MRSFLLQVLFLSMPYWAIAQLEDGSFAPDFELQDLNGNTWHLYELLEAGKHVILDFSATWCSPCWDYHEMGLLNEAYTLYGPESTNELMIFMIEGDDQTNVACLYDLPDCSLISICRLGYFDSAVVELKHKDVVRRSKHSTSVWLVAMIIWKKAIERS